MFVGKNVFILVKYGVIFFAIPQCMMTILKKLEKNKNKDKYWHIQLKPDITLKNNNKKFLPLNIKSE